MPEELSAVESLALKVGRPAELLADIEDYRQAILHPDPQRDPGFYPNLLKPKPLDGGLTNELQLGQMRRFLAACGDDARTGGANYKELMDQLDGDPIVLAAYLVFPDQKDWREALIREMTLASMSLNAEKKDYLIISPQDEHKNNLLGFGLEKMAWSRTISPEPETEPKDNQGKTVKFKKSYRSDKLGYELDLSITPIDSPMLAYKFADLEQAQTAIGSALKQLDLKETDELRVRLEARPAVTDLNRQEIMLLVNAGSAQKFLTDTSVYESIKVGQLNEEDFLENYREWTTRLINLGWVSEGELKSAESVLAAIDDGQQINEEKPEVVEKSTPDDDIILF